MVEFAAALGLILPAATDIAPVLTPLAATGLAVVMVLAAITHARRKEPGAIAFNAVLLILAALVAWGRSTPRTSTAATGRPSSHQTSPADPISPRIPPSTSTVALTG
ncbi:DoxX family protein [Streptomyces sp. NPDC005476]|uniref:DoxX family protein n=1 Tax=Streptomyces sp. NPDC005476 TaxID=3156882 RepID=UPI003451E968